MKKINWGIIGLGKIAHTFIQDLQLLENTGVVAVASRSEGKAKGFAKKYGVEKSYGSYSKLFEDPDVDIVYIATPHNSHAEWSIAAMNAGKHVLCEKPLAVNSSQARNMIEASHRNNVFLMEAFWSRFIPAIKECLELAKNGAIGEVNYVNADFCFYSDAPEDSRLFNMDLAGGALLDIGIYPLFLAYSVFGKPKEIQATSRFHRTGADLQTAVMLKFPKGIAATASGFNSTSDMTAKIYGSRGHIFLDPRWHETQGFTITVDGKSERVSRPKIGKGYAHEVEECIKCLHENKTESDLWSHQHSLDLLGILDEVRRQIGLRYPFE